MTYQVWTIDAFAKSGENETGNPAGVYFAEQALNDRTMQDIAKKVGFSETAFITRQSETVFNVRFFTPSAEVDLCGHATIGSFSALLQKGILSPGEYQQQTKAGLLAVKVYADGKILMEQAQPEYGKILEYPDMEKVAASLGLPTVALHEDLNLQLMSTGLWDLMVPLGSVQDLQRLQPDFEAIHRLSEQWDITGYHVFALTEGHDHSVQCRNFAPLYEIPEEAATGTSNGALGAYLADAEAVAPAFSVLQGVEMGRPSWIEVQVEQAEQGGFEIWVGGYGKNLSERSVDL